MHPARLHPARLLLHRILTEKSHLSKLILQGQSDHGPHN